MTYKQLRALLAVGYFANKQNGGVWASNRTLAEIAGLDERDLRRSLADLELRGYIRRLRRISDSGGNYTSIVDLVLDDEGVQSSAPGEGRIAPGGEGRNAPGDEGRSAPPKDTEERQQAASTTTTTPAPGLRFENPDHQEAYLEHRTAAPNRRAFDATLRALLQGMTTGKPVSESVLGLALMDMAANGETFNASRVRGYLRKHEAAQAAEAAAPQKFALRYTFTDEERARVAAELEAEYAAKQAKEAARA